MNYANIIIDNKSFKTDIPYTYASNEKLNIGSKVYVNFANRKKLLAGYVVEIDVKPNIDIKLIKEISTMEESKSLNEEIIKTALWIRNRYGVRFIDAINLFTINGKRPNEKIIKKAYDLDSNKIIKLNEEQIKAKESVCKALENLEQKAFLINGVTNSGKTEIYMEIIDKALKMGKNAIYLVPEIALTNQTKKRLSERFGEENIALIHSKLTGSVRLREWLKIKNGKARIVLGTRSAVFAPLINIGVIIMDEEHESTYKADKTPKYETVDIAYKRIKNHNGVLVMGSATPSIVSNYRANKGIYDKVNIKNRVDGSLMPEVAVVDMRNETRAGNFTPFSNNLYNEIKNTVSKKEQVILFINRRGHSTSIQCLECGHKVICEKCGVTMTYHKRENEMVCHYCGDHKMLYNKCPVCDSKYIKMHGFGTEKIEEEAQKLFDGCKIQRIDLDIAKKQSEVDNILSDFSKGNIDILIGTQIIAKGLDFKNVGLVGIVSADMSLNIPDYRSSERTYQLITQVAGRAGRGNSKGKVIVQTYTPDNYAINTAINYNYDEFYNIEINHRMTMKYPPFSDIIVVMFISEYQKKPKMYANECRKYLKTDKETFLFDIKESTRYKLNNKYQCYFMIKSSKKYRNTCIKQLSEFRKTIKDCNMDIDVNPYGII